MPVIPEKAGIRSKSRRSRWMPDHVRHDAQNFPRAQINNCESAVKLSIGLKAKAGGEFQPEEYM